MSSSSVVYDNDEEYPDSPCYIPEVVALKTESDKYGNKTHYFIVDGIDHRVLYDGTCQEVAKFSPCGNKIIEWKKCHIPILLIAHLLKQQKYDLS
jgi:hypothetical protein